MAHPLQDQKTWSAMEPSPLRTGESRTIFCLPETQKYWDDKNTTLSNVYYYPLDNPDASLRRYRANELDFTDTTPSEQLPWIKENLKEELKITPYFGSYYYGFNNTKPPFKDNPELRMALSLAVNRTIITDIVLGAGQIPAFTFVPPVKEYKGIQPEWAGLTQGGEGEPCEGFLSQSRL